MGGVTEPWNFLSELFSDVTLIHRRSCGVRTNSPWRCAASWRRLEVLLPANVRFSSGQPGQTWQSAIRSANISSPSGVFANRTTSQVWMESAGDLQLRNLISDRCRHTFLDCLPQQLTYFCQSELSASSPLSWSLHAVRQVCMKTFWPRVQFRRDDSRREVLHREFFMFSDELISST